MAVMDIVIQATDKASDVMEGVGERGSQAAGWLEENWAKVGLAMGAAGGAAEVAARKQAPLTEQTTRLADRLGKTRDEMRELAIDTADVTFPLEDVLDLMEIGAQRGLESEESMRKFAEQMDFVGDATGESAQAIAEGSTALEMAGISADNISEAFDAFGYITEHTTASVDEFQNFVGRAGRELGDNTPHVNDMAAALGALEDEGYDARLAQRELQSALREADGDMNAALETLGISEEKFKEYTGAVEGSEEVLHRNAEAHEETYTTMERMQHRAEELMYRYGDLIGVAGDLAPAMMAVGPAIKGVSVAKQGLSRATTVLNAGLWKTVAAKAALLAPIALVVAAVAGLVLGIRHLWNTNEEFREFIIGAWEAIKETALAVWEGIQDAIGRFIEFFQEAWGNNEEIIEALQETWEHLQEVGAEIWEAIQETIEVVMAAIRAVIETVAAAIQAFWEEWGQAILIVAETIWEQIKLTVETAIEIVKDVIMAVLAVIRGDWEEAWEHIQSIGETVWNYIEETVENIFTGIRDFFAEVMTTIRDNISERWEAIKDVFGRALQWVYDNTVGRLQELLSRFGEILSQIVNTVSNWRTDLRQRAGQAAQAAFDAIVRTIQRLPQRMLSLGRRVISNLARGVRNAVSDTLRGAIDSATSMLNRINPFSRSSPSLVDQVEDGVKKIQQLYGGLDLPEFDRPQVGSPAMAMAQGMEAVAERRQEARHETKLINFEKMFEGANITITSEAQARALAKELWGIAENKARSEGEVID